MQFQKRCFFWVSVVCCFCTMLTLFSSTAFAAEAGGGINFVELCGLELADGESKWVAFEGDDWNPSVKVTNATTVDDFVEKMNGILQNYGIVFSYDRTLGQFIAVDEDGGNVNFVLSADGKELTYKPPVSTPPTPSGSTTMSQLLNTITEVFATSIEWIAAVSSAVVANPILLFVVAVSFIGTGISLFKRLLNV